MCETKYTKCNIPITLSSFLTKQDVIHIVETRCMNCDLTTPHCRHFLRNQVYGLYKSNESTFSTFFKIPCVWTVIEQESILMQNDHNPLKSTTLTNMRRKLILPVLVVILLQGCSKKFWLNYNLFYQTKPFNCSEISTNCFRKQSKVV